MTGIANIVAEMVIHLLGTGVSRSPRPRYSDLLRPRESQHAKYGPTLNTYVQWGMSSMKPRAMSRSFATVALLLINLQSFAADLNAAHMAQVTPPAAASASEDPAPLFEEIVVTAQKRDTDIQKTAIAVAGLSGAELERKAVQQVSDLQNATPSLSVI
jgi:hypothetical protein